MSVLQITAIGAIVESTFSKLTYIFNSKMLSLIPHVIAQLLITALVQTDGTTTLMLWRS